MYYALFQTIIIWNLSASDLIVSNGELKQVLKDHDHTVECIAWAPESATPFVNETLENDMVS